MSFIKSFRDAFSVQSEEEKKETAAYRDALKDASTGEVLIAISKNMLPTSIPQYLIDGGALAAGVTGTIMMSTATPVVASILTIATINATMNNDGEAQELCSRAGKKMKAIYSKKMVQKAVHEADVATAQVAPAVIDPVQQTPVQQD